MQHVTNKSRLTLLTALALVAGIVGVGCGDASGDPKPAARKPAVSEPERDNVGTGVLAATRFVRTPIVTYQLDTSGGGGYAVYARLNRDVPRRPDGYIRATFQVAGIDAYDHIFTDSRSKHCVSEGIQFSLAEGAPHIAGSRVKVVLNATDAHGDINGTLATTATLTKMRTGDPHDYGPDPIPRQLGC